MKERRDLFITSSATSKLLTVIPEATKTKCQMRSVGFAVQHCLHCVPVGQTIARVAFLHKRGVAWKTGHQNETYYLYSFYFVCDYCHEYRVATRSLQLAMHYQKQQRAQIRANRLVLSSLVLVASMRGSMNRGGGMLATSLLATHVVRQSLQPAIRARTAWNSAVRYIFFMAKCDIYKVRLACVCQKYFGTIRYR